MILDIHAHVAYHKLYALEFIRTIIPEFRKVTEMEISIIAKRFLNDDGCVYLKKQMEQANISKTVLLIIDPGIDNKTEYSIEEIHEYHYQILKDNPGLFFVFSGIDPRRGLQGATLFRKAITDYGFTGLKFYPATGFHLTIDYIHLYLKLCRNYHVPVMIHVEPESIIKDERKYFNEIYNLVKHYTRIKFILAHTGFRVNNQYIKNIFSLPNCYLDISGFQKYTQSMAAITSICNTADKQRILFGTDWPLFHTMRPLSDDIELLNKMLIDVHVNKSDVDDILYNNSIKLFAK